MSRAGSCYRASVCRGEACFAPTHFTRSRVLSLELSDTLTQVSRLPEPLRAPYACSSRRGDSPGGDSPYTFHTIPCVVDGALGHTHPGFKAPGASQSSLCM